MKRAHAMPFGAEPLDGGGVRFNLWAPGARDVSLLLYGPQGGEIRLSMEARDGGWRTAEAAEADPGTGYHYLVDGSLRVPDPASRFQPEDVHGPSEVVDPAAYRWTETGWAGRSWEEAVLYELHVGAFTPEGTYRGAMRKLDHLAGLGVTAVELMPVAEFPGTRNWGYDGVLPFAPDASYGRPEDLKALVEAAHARKLMIFLDVVYNHFGPEGNYLHAYAPGFFTERYHTPWGAAIDFEDPESRPVREFFIHNALYWLEEFHMDGLRFDAVHAIKDASEPDILTELAERVRAACDRDVFLVLENDLNAAHRLVRDTDERPLFYTAQWNDDYHHAMHVLLTGEDGGYYIDYADAPARHLGRTLAEGFAYQGEASEHRDGVSRGEPSVDLPPLAFVDFIQNHDQIGNRAFGERIDASAEDRAVEAAVAVMLLAPSPPLLFMGEEWAAPNPFPFFCDFHDELADKVREGRRREFACFPAFRDPAARERIPDPNAEDTFRRAVLDWDCLTEPPHKARLALYRTLLDLRGREIVPRLPGIDGAAAFTVLGDRGIDVQWRLGDGSRLRLLANFGDAAVNGVAPPSGRLLHATGNAAEEYAGGSLPAWSVLWFLDERPA